MNMSKKSDIMKLLYKNEKSLYNCIVIAGKDKLDNTIVFSDTDRFKVSYNFKSRRVHGMNYVTNICEIIIYPYFIVKNYLSNAVFLGNRKIEKGVSNMYFENKRLRFVYNNNFKSKNELNLNSYEILNILYMKDKEKESMSGDIYTRSHIFGKRNKSKDIIRKKTVFSNKNESNNLLDKQIQETNKNINDTESKELEEDVDYKKPVRESEGAINIEKNNKKLKSKLDSNLNNNSETKYDHKYVEKNIKNENYIQNEYYIKYNAPLYKNIAIEMVYGKGKYTDTKILSIKYANIFFNDSEYTFFIVCEGEIQIVKPYESVFLHFSKHEGFYIYFYDEYGFSLHNESESKYLQKDNINENQICRYDLYHINHKTYKINNKSENYLNEKGIYVIVKGISPIFFHLVRNERILFRLEIIFEGKQRKIRIKESYEWPLSIYNNSNLIVVVRQKDAAAYHTLYPKKKYNFCFDEPNLPKKLVISNGKTKIEFTDEKKIIKKSMILYHYTIGNKKMIEITDIMKEKPVKIKNFKFECKIEFLSISMYDKEEILCIHLKNTTLSMLKYMLDRQEKTLFEFTVKGMQVDDQNIFSKCPVKMYPKNKTMNVLYNKKNKEKDNNYFLVAMIEIINKKYTEKKINENFDEVMYNSFSNSKNDKIRTILDPIDDFTQVNDNDLSFIVNFCSLLIQPFSLHIYENTLTKIMNFIKSDPRKNFVLQCDICERIKCICCNNKIEKTKNIRINTLHIHPMIIQITFKKGEGENDFYSKLLKYLVENVSDFNITFNASLMTEIENPIESILDLLKSNYKSQIYNQILKIIVSVDFLGNIGSLTDTFSIGVKDLFYEPYLGLKEDNPKKFTMGLLKGGTSFVKNTVSGVTGTIGKFTSSLSKGIGLATFDKEFQNYSPMYQNKYLEELGMNLKIKDKLFDSSNPIHSGLRRFKTSIFSGVSGVFNKPVEGAKEGFTGFIKGIGKGTMGLVTKPIVGIADLAGGITDKIKKELDDNTIYRIQFPRRNAIEEYNTIQNMCFFVFKRYIRDDSNFICGTIDDELYLILTSKFLYFVSGKNLTQVSNKILKITDNYIEFDEYKIGCSFEFIHELDKVQKNNHYD